MNAVHLTARTFADAPLADEALCRRVWRTLQRHWDAPLACCLMRNHLHLLIPGGDAKAERETLTRALAQTPGWPPSTSDATVPTGRVKVRRDIRYIALNPCRAHAAADPLEWAWSTHREVVGALHEPWVDRRAVLSLERGRDPVESHHLYVSGDPSVAIQGPVPRPVRPEEISAWPIAALMRAAISATRGGSLRRRGPTRTIFLQLAREQGWTRATELARICQAERSAVYRAWKAPDIAGPGRVCLADRRLRALTLPTAPERHEVWR